MSEGPMPHVAASSETEAPARPVPTSSRPVSHLPRWRVLLHNDDVNDMGYVVQVLVRIRAVDAAGAVLVMFEAHRNDVGVVMETHREHAELVTEQLCSAGLSATLERASS